MKIEVGDYIRTKENGIKKVKEIKYCGEEGIYYITDWVFGVWDKDIVKHSKDLIDLIEVGDFVNGKLIHKIENKSLYYGNCKKIENKQIKIILTREQYEQEAYKVKGGEQCV